MPTYEVQVRRTVNVIDEELAAFNVQAATDEEARAIAARLVAQESPQIGWVLVDQWRDAPAEQTEILYVDAIRSNNDGAGVQLPQPSNYLIATFSFAHAGIELELWTEGFSHLKADVVNTRNGRARRPASNASIEALLRLYGPPVWLAVEKTK